MSNYIPVEGNADLVRDPNTDQIINTNESAYQQYITRRQKRKSENCLLYTSPSPRDLSTSRMPSSA